MTWILGLAKPRDRFETTNNRHLTATESLQLWKLWANTPIDEYIVATGGLNFIHDKKSGNENMMYL